VSPKPELAPPPPPPRPIYIIKKKVQAADAHHGGAWKVAYADFVTAMMALFIVLWLMSADESVKKEIASFFNNPSGVGNQTGTNVAGSGTAIEIPKEDMAKLREKIEQALKTVPNFRDLKENVEITITTDGLRIELLETQAGMFFESGRPLPSKNGAELLARLADELGKLPNKLLIEGHTDAQPWAGDGYYSNWELSSDRANSARRLMEMHGVRKEQVAQVRGFADRHLRHPNDPLNPANRRISVIIQYLVPPDTDAKRDTAIVVGESEAQGGKAAAKDGGKQAGKDGGNPPAAPVAQPVTPAPQNAKTPEPANPKK
jgi:chemotaxis protein MotB